MKNRTYIVYGLSGLILLSQISIMIRYWMYDNLSNFNWILFAFFVILVTAIVIDPLGKHAPKLTRIGAIKLILVLLAVLLIGFNLGRTF